MTQFFLNILIFFLKKRGENVIFQKFRQMIKMKKVRKIRVCSGRAIKRKRMESEFYLVGQQTKVCRWVAIWQRRAPGLLQTPPPPVQGVSRSVGGRAFGVRRDVGGVAPCRGIRRSLFRVVVRSAELFRCRPSACTQREFKFSRPFSLSLPFQIRPTSADNRDSMSGCGAIY